MNAELEGLSPANLKKLQIIIAAMILGFATADEVKAAAAGPGPDALISGMQVDHYMACLHYWKMRQAA